MPKVNFKFDIDQMVETVLEEKGIVTSCSLDNSRVKQYYVLTTKGGNWFKEEQLKKVK